MERVAFDSLLTATVPSIEEAARRYATQYNIFPAWKDIAQSAFLKMLRFADQYDPAKGELLPWACVILINTIKTFLAQSDMEYNTLIIERTATEDHSTVNTIQAAFIFANLNTEAQLYIEGYNYQEIAARCGVKSRATVMNRIDKCAEHLSRIMGIKTGRGRRDKNVRKNFNADEHSYKKLVT